MQFHFMCDFDGTVTKADVTDVLLEKFADPQWRDIEAEWQAGRIGSKACMTRQIALMRCTREALDSVLDDIAIDPGFPDFVAEARRRGSKITIVSDGLDYTILKILGRYGLQDLPIFANKLIFGENDSLTLSCPHSTDACRSNAGTCKCAVADRARRDDFPIVLIGDGRSDFCAAASVDLAFAKESLLQHCKTQNIPHAPFASFAEMPQLMANLIEAAADASISSIQFAGKAVALSLVRNVS